tara:strand:+ start:333 stop:602 length:270 start_codon:yes stop_codon:yes gene_type:complete
MKNPYKDTRVNDKKFMRTFLKETDGSYFVWHRDEEDRKITVLHGHGWKFQREDELPVDLKLGEVFDIGKNDWHRLIKGNSDLILLIERL